MSTSDETEQYQRPCMPWQTTGVLQLHISEILSGGRIQWMGEQVVY